jgi:glycosyltransferase involved in cell wall biosynthesis
MECRASIVIPAHNEEHRIRGLLQSLSEASLPEQYAIFVICNGCTDRTREVAEEFAGIRVVEIDDVGKYFALNEGDRLAGDVFPRLYCDADIRIDFSSIQRLVDQLTTDQVIAAGPTVRYGVDGCSWGTRKYYHSLGGPIMTKWQDLHLVGRGIYGVSREARKRFGAFPPLFADDKFFDSQFSDSEKVVVPGAVATIWIPVTIRELIKNETRVAKGNRQLSAYLENGQGVDGGAAAAATRVRRGPLTKLRTLRQWSKDLRLADCVPLVIYLSVTGTTRLYLALLRVRQRQIGWR